jgi:DNA-binding CsgD family transcriptional regulator
MSEEVSSLAIGLYEALLDEGGVLPALTPVARRVGASSHFTHLFAYRRGRPVESVASGLGGAAGAPIEEYGRFWVRHDPRPVVMPSLPLGVHDMASVVPPEALRRSRAWREWGQPNDAGFHSITIPVLREAGHVGCIVFARRESEAPFAPEDREILEGLFPHLRRIYLAENQLAEARRAPAGLWRGMDALPDGVALVDGARGLGFANLAMQRIAAQGDGMVLGGPTGLVIADPAARAALARAVNASLAAAGGRVRLLPLAATIPVPRPSGQASWLVRVLPLPRGAAAPGPGVAPGVLLLVADPDARAAPAAATLAGLFGLTPAEAALAAAIAGGRGAQEHARRRGIAKETVRSHLAALRRKTGCRSQADLVALFARLAR